MKMSLKQEISSLKADFFSLQSLLKEKLISMEVRINEIEGQVSRNEPGSLPKTHSSVYYDKENTTFCHQEVDNRARNIIEELMWESTLSEAVLHVRQTFKDQNSREKFLRSSFELVLEKDEQYRKMIGTLFGFLINQNIVSPTNVFNSLSSVLLVIENSNNYNTQMWQNLTEILLPMLSESHIKLSQLQRKAHTILKPDYCREFIAHLQNAVEENRKKIRAAEPTTIKSEYFPPSMNQEPETRDFKVDVQPAVNTNCMDLPNIYDLESLSKFKPVILDPCLEPEPVTKLDAEVFLNNLSVDNLDESLHQLKRLTGNQFQSAIEEIVDMGIHKEHEQRVVIGTLLSLSVSQDIVDIQQLLSLIYKNVQKVERLIVNQKTRAAVVEAFADIVSPLFSNDKVTFDMLSAVAATILSEETKTIFVWSIERLLNERGIRTEKPVQHLSSPKPVNQRMFKRFFKYIGGGRPFGERDEVNNSLFEDPRTRVSADRQDKNVVNAAAENDLLKPWPEDDTKLEDKADHDTYVNLKRKKLLKERIDNIGDKADIKIAIDDSHSVKSVPQRRLPEGEGGDGGAPTKGVEELKSEAEQSLAPPTLQQTTIANKQPENLPSSAIKEKMEEIIETLMKKLNIDECVTMIKETFNECQTDLVFKAAFEYTKDKTSEYRIQCGKLISEAYKHDPKRIGAQIMNTISLELGDYEDTPKLWKGMAEIIGPPMINGLIKFSDLKLLPKYFLHTNHCASLLLAILHQIKEHKGSEWLEENWKKSKVEFSMFLPLSTCYGFILDNALEFCAKPEEIQLYKENTEQIG